jgi:lysozyme family protein
MAEPNWTYANPLIVEAEGGISTDKQDRGNQNVIQGETLYTDTRYGMTFQAWLSYTNSGDYKNLTKRQFNRLKKKFDKLSKEDVNKIFEEDFNKKGYDKVNSPKVAASLADANINQGFTFGSTNDRTLIDSLNSLGYNYTTDDIKSKEDAIRLVNLAIEEKGEDAVLDAYALRRQQSYDRSAKKGNNAKFHKGWHNRLNKHRTKDTQIDTDNTEYFADGSYTTLEGEANVEGGRVIANLDSVAEGETVVEEAIASDNKNENIEDFERYAQSAYGDGFEVRQQNGRMVIVKMPVPEGEPEPTPNYEEENVEEMNYSTYVNQGRQVAPPNPNQPQVLDPEGNIVDQPTDEEGEAARRAEEERQRQEEEAENQRRIIKRANDAKEFQELRARNKELQAAYKPEDMPAVFAREIRNNNARIAEIEEEYNLTKVSDEEYEARREEIVANIISDDPQDNQTLDEVLDEVYGEGEEIEEEEEIIAPEGLETGDLFYQNGNLYEVADNDTTELIVEGISPTVPENAQSGDLFYDDGNTYEVREDGTILFVSPTRLETDEYANRNTINAPIDLGEVPTSEIPDDADINQGVATWENENGQTVQARVGEVDDAVDPNVPVDETIDTDETVNQTTTTSPNNTVTTSPTDFMSTLGDIGNVVQQGLGIIDSVRRTINNEDDLILGALGKKAYNEAMKEITPSDHPELSYMFKQQLEQTRQLSKMGFSPEEAQAARANIDAAYGKGIENAVRGTAGNRAQFLAMSGVLDSQRSSALLDFAAKDAELNRRNQDSYLKALSFAEEYNLNKSKAERAEELQLELQKKKGASDFASKAFTALQQKADADRLTPLMNRYAMMLNNSLGSPYNSPLTIPTNLTLNRPNNEQGEN